LPIVFLAVKTPVSNITSSANVTPNVAGFTFLFVAVQIRHVSRLTDITLISFDMAFLATREQILAPTEGSGDLVLDKTISCLYAFNMFTRSWRKIDVIADLDRVTIGRNL
jgi:hypothetical protein